MDGFELSDLRRRVRDIVRGGVIHSVQMSPPRCRVTFGIDPISGNEHVTTWLPWFTRSDAEKQEWSVPAAGSPATVFSEGGELRGGVVLAGYITDDQAAASDSPHQHITRYGNGATVMYDTQTNQAEISLPEGGKVIVIASGGIELQGNVNITGDLNVTGNITDNNGGSGSLQDLRVKYNGHTHNENGETGGVTDPPNEPIKSKEIVK
ncbi:phage baseplate assembly protein V [Buttiauxella sp. 3AFRM03]|uniref:phage baseplate assembly protein V n=1 Tax=Buttiauxella sp. 3AFRM03 TaxID=2479367 RepID=UPI000EF7A07C|nr:phage baseplate assembly protein V [Buttiauxella sp. 3AFRM03]AYN30006.1 phage baseplate assembly protein V [Buttiauxella sp. 3AFRM03]